VLIITAHNAPELEGRTSRARALHFIKKPFELTEFAAVTEALLSSSVSASEAASGALRDLALVDFILLQAASAATTALEVETPQGRSGEIHFAGGRICHAMVMGKAGSPALEEMMRWPVTSCREIERRTDAPRSIRGEWKDVLSRAWRAVDRTDTPVSKSEPGPSSALLPRRKLVVIDDTEMLLILVKEVLGAADPSFEITTAKSGKEGVERISALIPDLVLLDYSLPDITGSEVCRRLLADQQTADIPLIMMSGHVVEMMAAAGEHPNIVATIAKPFLSTSLVALVNQTLVDLANPAPETPKRRKAGRVKAGKPHPTRTDHGESRNGNPMAAATLSRKPSSSSAKEPVTPPASGPSESEAPGTGTQGDSPPAQNSEVLPSSPAPPKPASPEPAAPLPGASSEMRTETISPGPAIGTAPSHVREFQETPLRISSSATRAAGVAPAAIQAARYNAVVVHLPLDVVSLQFSPALRMTAIRARPSSHLVSLHISPQAVPGSVITEAGFEIVRVDLDLRGQIDLIRLAPAGQALPAYRTEQDIAVQNLTVLPTTNGHKVELTPLQAAPMQMQLLALFELCGVQLSPEFGVGQLVLKSRGGVMRVSLQPDAMQSGATFETAQILLDRSARIAEILLDTLV